MLSAIKQMELYSQKYPDVISLAQGIPGTSSDALIKYEVMQAILNNQVDTYSNPAGLLQLRESISERLLEEGMNYTRDEIIVTAGATEAMTSTLLAVTNPGDEVLIPTPTYSAFLRSAKTAHLKVLEIPLIEEKDWHLDLDFLQKAITKKTKAIILCNPNNPTGSIYDRETLKKIMKFVMKHNLYLVIDEVYKNMVYDEVEVFNVCSDARFKKHIVRIVSFSKDFSLTGWRVGFLHSAKENIDKILEIHDSLVNCAPVVSQYATMSALKYDEQIIQEHKKMYMQHRQIVGETLESLRETFDVNWPKGSYFFFPKLRKGIDANEFCLELLEKERLALVPGTDFGSGGEGHIRICFGRNTDSIIEGMNRLKRYCQNYE